MLINQLTIACSRPQFRGHEMSLVHPTVVATPRIITIPAAFQVNNPSIARMRRSVVKPAKGTKCLDTIEDSALNQKKTVWAGNGGASWNCPEPMTQHKSPNDRRKFKSPKRKKKLLRKHEFRVVPCQTGESPHTTLIIDSSCWRKLSPPPQSGRFVCSTQR